MKSSLKALALVAVIPLFGCGVFDKDRGTSMVYAPGQIMKEQAVRHGVVEAVREVEIKKDVGALSVGSAVGAIVGGVAAASNIGEGRGSDVAGLLGAVAGSLAGQAIEEQIGKQKGLEITLKLSTGDVVSVTQAVSNDVFRPGDSVRLLTSGGVTRVTR